MSATTAQVQVKERPIPFTAEQVRATLEGRMTQTRRVVKFPEPPPSDLKCASDCQGVLYEQAFPGVVWGVTPGFFVPCVDGAQQRWRNPWNFPNERTRLWVREAWRHQAYGGLQTEAGERGEIKVRYVATDEKYRRDYSADAYFMADHRYRTSAWATKSQTCMPRWASRLTLEITNVRVERLEDLWYWIIEFKKL